MKNTGAKKPRPHILKYDTCWCKPTVTTTISKDGKEKVTVISHHDQPMTTKNNTTSTDTMAWFDAEFEKLYPTTYPEHSVALRLLVDKALATQRTALIEQIERERKSVEELLPTMGVPPYNDLASQVAYKEGYNQAVDELNAKLTALRKEV